MTADEAYDTLCSHHMRCTQCEDARGDSLEMCAEGAELYRQWIRAEYRQGQADAGESHLRSLESTHEGRSPRSDRWAQSQNGPLTVGKSGL